MRIGERADTSLSFRFKSRVLICSGELGCIATFLRSFYCIVLFKNLKLFNYLKGNHEREMFELL